MQLTITERTSGEVIASGSENEVVKPFEGNWYFTPDAVNMEHLRVTERTYTCPYKGTCYWIDLETASGRAQNVAWIYQRPKPGYEFIKDQIGFYARNTSGTIASQS